MMEEAINNEHVIENLDSKQSSLKMEQTVLESNKTDFANNTEETGMQEADSNSSLTVNDPIQKTVDNTNSNNDHCQNAEETIQHIKTEDVSNNATPHELKNTTNSSNGEHVIHKNSLEQLCAEIVGDTDLGDGALDSQENADQQCIVNTPIIIESSTDTTPVIDQSIEPEIVTICKKDSSEIATPVLATNEDVVVNIPEPSMGDSLQPEDTSSPTDIISEMSKIIYSEPVEISNIPLPHENESSTKVLENTLEHTNNVHIETNDNHNDPDKTIETDVEISLIHGEPPEVDSSIIESLSSKNLKYISKVSTQDIIDVYDKQDTLRKMHEIANPSTLLNNSIDCFKDSINSDTNSGCLVNLGQDMAVMNNSQLLAILEDGNDQVISTEDPEKNKKTNVVLKRRPRAVNMDPAVEGQLALKQLKEMPVLKRKSVQKISQIVDVKIPKTAKKFIIVKKTPAVSTPPVAQTSENCDPLKSTPVVKTYSKKVSDISDLIGEWDDDKPEDQTEEITLSTNNSVVLETSIDTPKISAVKKPDVLIPQRVSRIIKKKIIFDPDNPDTFKFAAAIIKKDKVQDVNVAENYKLVIHKNDLSKSVNEVESKKISNKVGPKLLNKSVMSEDEIDPLAEQVVSKAKVGRPRLVKPAPNKINLLNAQLDKPRKQTSPILTPSKKKKMTEVDRLLMDEGAVNMLYEMSNNNSEDATENEEGRPNKKSTVLVSKEKKSMMSKAKIIKRAVFSLTKSDDPSKVLKVFRSRKEGVQKSNRLRSGMQSPTTSEISVSGSVADESRIIRRHSSSSFSSGCLSPRPSSPENATRLNSTQSDESYQLTNDSGIQSLTPLKSNSSFENIVPVPMSVSKIKRRGRPPNSISGKLKRMADDVDSSYQRKTVLPISGLSVFDSFTQLSLAIGDDRVARIIIQPTGNSEELYDFQVLKELATAIRVSNQAGALLLTSEHGNLCSGLDLRCVIQPTVQLQRENAENILTAFRELAVAMCECECGIVSGVDGACSGAGVPLLTLSDLSLASDRASFCAAPRTRRPMPPEGSSLLVRPHSLPPQLSRELVLCGRKLTASEALQRGLVSRTLWPDRFLEEIKSIAADLTTHPPESFKIMKGVLRRGESEAVVAALRHEGKMLMDFWCSAEGQEAIQKTHEHL